MPVDSTAPEEALCAKVLEQLDWAPPTLDEELTPWPDCKVTEQLGVEELQVASEPVLGVFE